MYALSFRSPAVKKFRSDRFTAWADGFAAYHVRSVSARWVVDEPVFNLETSPTQTYVAGGVIVHNCVRKKARDLASAPLVAQTVGHAGELDALAYDHPLAVLLRRPNPDLSGRGLLAFTSTYLDLTGNAFWLVLRDRRRRPAELYPWR